MSYHEILGVDNGCSVDEIRKIYRKLSLKYHPDRNGNSEESKKQFQKINNAYCKLLETSPDKNDNMREMAHFYNKEPLDGISPIQVTVYITLEQSYTGCMLPVEIDRYIKEGNSNRTEKETIYVEFYKGIDTNEVITYHNKGNGLNQKYSDVRILVQIKPHDFYTRDGLDLIYTKKITLKEALCGVTFQILHISGKTYNIKGDTIITPNFIKSIRGLGLTRGDHVGNLIIKFIVTFPETLSKQQIEQIKKYL